MNADRFFEEDQTIAASEIPLMKSGSSFSGIASIRKRAGPV